MLTVERLDAWYGEAHILSDVSLSVGPGEVVALLGRNGAGKSTTLRAIMGLVARRQGTVSLAGRDVSRWPTHEIVQAGLGYVPEDRRIFSDLTVKENLEVGRRPARMGLEPWTPQRLHRLFPNLREMEDRPGRLISGGEQQMLAIARTLMGNPTLVLLDEPSEGLAPRIVEELAGAILAMKRVGLGLVICEQNLHFARLVSDRVTIIESGRIRFAASLAEFDSTPNIGMTFLAI